MATYTFDAEFATQYQSGWHPQQTAGEIADMLGLSASEVAVAPGVITTAVDLTAEQEYRLEHLVGLFTGRPWGEMGIVSRPPVGSHRVTNIWRTEDGKIEVEYDDTPV